MLREGLGGGQRVSAASAEGDWTTEDIAAAEQAMREMGQRPLFQVRDGESGLDAALAARGYEIRDPVWLYAAPIGAVLDVSKLGHTAFPVWPIPAIARQIWAEGGIGPGRLAVMERAGDPKTAFLARAGQTPAGVGFAALDGDIAMIHAIEVRPTSRRKGVGADILVAFSQWAQDVGASWIGLAVTKENFAANGLYAKLGMAVVTHYHYRRGQE